MTRRGTGEVMRGRSTEERTWREQNYRQRETEGRTKTLKGHSGAWKIRTKTQQDLIQKHKCSIMTGTLSTRKDMT